MKDPRFPETPSDSSTGSRPVNWLVAGCLLIPLILTAGSGFMQLVEEDSSTDIPAGAVLTVNTIQCRTEESIRELRSFTGIVKARRTSDLSLDRAGRIIRLSVSEGDLVKSGQPIAELDQRRLELKKATLEGALERAQAAFDALDPTAAAMTIEDMRATLQRLRTELNQLEADLAARSRAATDPTVTNLDRLRNIERQVAILNETSRRQKIEAQTKLVDELTSQLKDLELELDGGTLVAPYDGMIALRHVNVGTVVSAGMPIVRLVDHQALEAWVGIPVEMGSQIQLGEKVVVKIGEDTLDASAKAKLPQLDQSTRTRTVIFELQDTAADRILPGEVVRVELLTANALAGIWLPLSALNRQARGLWSVFVVAGEPDQQIVSRRYVEVLQLENNRALVRGTLDDGELVIANGTHRVVPGQRVKSKDAPAPSSASGPDRGPS